ncbi:MAG: TRAP transporter small permease [Desulfuromonas sp.]|nr:MAG: TRAP transporter small permease [Desulfuromonas sp.]
MIEVVRKLRRRLHQFEDLLLSLLLCAMVLLAVGQIAMRNLFNSGVSWGDELLRIMVLWLTLLGAMVASREDRHITIDLFSRLLPKPLILPVRVFVDLFTATVCAIVAWHALSFVRLEAEFGSTLLGDLPSWPLQAIIPVGFTVIALRYLLHALLRFTSPQIKQS